MQRYDGRTPNDKRPIKISTNFTQWAEGSVLIETGNTKVICAASVEETVPIHLRGKEQGWVTAEYSMLPRSTQTRTPREAAKGKQKGRTLEIQRLIGRSLRAITDMKKLGERTITIDCDVIQADGGTRTASITGGFVALALAIKNLESKNLVEKGTVLRENVAAISVGIIGGTPMLDLDYSEDSTADVDMNIVMTENGQFIELQGTAEGNPFNDAELAKLIELGRKGIAELIYEQKKAIDLTFING